MDQYPLRMRAIPLQQSSMASFALVRRPPVQQLEARATALGQEYQVDAVVLSCCDMPTIDASSPTR